MLAIDSYQKDLELKESAELWVSIGAVQYQLGNIDAADASWQYARDMSNS